jgi:hypothetical protein
MPQGRAKKIEVQLLLADLAFKLRDPALTGVLPQCGRNQTRSFLRAAGVAGHVQRSSPASTEFTPPDIQQMAAEAEFGSQNGDVRRVLHAGQRLQLKLTRPVGSRSRLSPRSELFCFGHTRSPLRTVCFVPVSQFRGHSTVICVFGVFCGLFSLFASTSLSIPFALQPIQIRTIRFSPIPAFPGYGLTTWHCGFSPHRSRR